MDYTLPRADNLPFINVHFRSTPATNNLLQIKGSGQAGVIGATQAVISALTDALGITHIEYAGNTCGDLAGDPDKGGTGERVMADKITKTEAEWRAQLTPEQYHVTREHGTERAFTGPLNKVYDDGMYHCVCCGEIVCLRYEFDSGSGWLSFYGTLGNDAVESRR